MILRGTTAVKGKAAGRLLILRKKSRKRRRRLTLTRLKEEVEKYRDYLQRISLDVGAGSIYRVYEAILQDPQLWEKVEALLHDGEKDAFRAFARVIEAYASELSRSEHEKFRNLGFELRMWLRDFENFVQGQHSDIMENSSGSIVVGEELNIMDVFRIIKYGVAGVVLEKGSLTSHPILMLKSRGIPTLIKVEDAVSRARRYRYALLDATEGFVELSNRPLEIYVNERISPRPVTIEGGTVRTADGEEVTLQINVDIPEELEEFRGLDVGLFRTEYLYLMGIVSRDDQEYIYRKLSESIYPNTLTIRLFDLGGEKAPLGMDIPPHVRGIRYLLEYNRKLLEDQIEAINRASEKGNVRVLIPMVSTVEEVLEVRRILRADIPLGIMIETPASALIMDRFKKYADFFSVGTNDLTQYVMAVDRKVSDYRFHPAIFRLVWYSFDRVRYQRKRYSVCGDLAANRMGLLALLSLGIRVFSVPPAYLSEAVKVIERVNGDILRDIRRRIMTAYSERDVERALSMALEELGIGPDSNSRKLRVRIVSGSGSGSREGSYYPVRPHRIVVKSSSRPYRWGLRQFGLHRAAHFWNPPGRRVKRFGRKGTVEHTD